MKSSYINRTIFIGKSLLWSVLLYTAVILILDWDEMRSGLKDREAMPLAKASYQAAPAVKVKEGTKTIAVISILWKHLSHAAQAGR